MISDSLHPRLRGAIERPQRCIDTAERLEQRVLAREWMEIQRCLELARRLRISPQGLIEPAQAEV
jgi:type II secretory pathway component PulJ